MPPSSALDGPVGHLDRVGVASSVDGTGEEMGEGDDEEGDGEGGGEEGAGLARARVKVVHGRWRVVIVSSLG